MSPAGRLTTKSVVRWPELRLVQVRRKDGYKSESWARVRETRRERDQNRVRNGTHGGARRSRGGIVILILRTKTTQGKVYILVVTRRSL